MLIRQKDFLKTEVGRDNTVQSLSSHAATIVLEPPRLLRQTVGIRPSILWIDERCSGRLRSRQRRGRAVPERPSSGRQKRSSAERTGHDYPHQRPSG
jgi:hypothetical protein